MSEKTGKENKRMEFLLTIFILTLLILFSSIKILREYERGVIFLLGRFWRIKGFILGLDAPNYVARITLEQIVCSVNVWKWVPEL